MNITFLIIGILILIFLANSINVLQTYERAVVFRLGKFAGVKGPGLVPTIPFIDKIIKFKLGKDGDALSDIDPDKGKISINGIEYNAVSEDKIKKGENIKIVDIEEKNQFARSQFAKSEEEEKFVIKVKKKEV